MTTWKDGGDYGVLYREIVSEDGNHAICRVKVRQPPHHAKFIDRKETMPYPQGEEDYRLILKAPLLLEALEAIVALEILQWPTIAEVADIYEQSMKIARAAIAVVKGESNEDELV